MDKYEFIQKLLSNKNLSSNQLEKILNLTKIEIKNDSNLHIQLEKRVIALEKKIKIGTTNDPVNNSKNLIYHNPQIITNFLNRFRQNTELKWTTHNWDEKKYENIEVFLEALNSDNAYADLFNYNRDLYNLIRYFIYDPKIEIAEDIPKYGWPNENDIKIGWQYPNNLLLNWHKQNLDKSPFQFLLPKHLRFKKNGKEIKYFENVVDIFKSQIQFRVNSLYNVFEENKKTLVDYKWKGIDDLNGVEFYTYTPSIKNAIKKIFNQIKKYETEKTIEISTEIKDRLLTIYITHLNSFPNKKLDINYTDSFLGGDSKAIAETLFGLADFSLISTFDTNEGNQKGEIQINYKDLTGIIKKSNIQFNSTATFKKLKEIKNGFTYKLTFYL